MDRAASRAVLAAVPALALAEEASPLEELTRLRRALGGGPPLLVKRDDALPFAFGGNKVRKLRLLVAEALAPGADTLLTLGGVQSNHARATGAFAARLGLRRVLALSGTPSARPNGNALLDELLGAELEYAASREERERLLLDPVYKAKAMAGPIARVRAGAFEPNQTVLFWHTGGLPGLFA